MPRLPSPIPLFDNIESLEDGSLPSGLSLTQKRDYHQARQFLLCYKDNSSTFVSYRREIEKFLQWVFVKANKSLKQLRRDDLDGYIKFCMKPPKSWIGLKKVARFKNNSGKRDPNSEWRPFVATISKEATMKGEKPSVEDYIVSQKSLKDIFTVTSTFFNFLIQEDYAQINPVQQIKQKNKYFTGE